MRVITWLWHHLQLLLSFCLPILLHFNFPCLLLIVPFSFLLPNWAHGLGRGSLCLKSSVILGSLALTVCIPANNNTSVLWEWLLHRNFDKGKEQVLFFFVSYSVCCFIISYMSRKEWCQQINLVLIIPMVAASLKKTYWGILKLTYF